MVNYVLIKTHLPKGVSDKAPCTVLATQFCLSLTWEHAHKLAAEQGRKNNRGFWPRILCPALGLEHRPDLGAQSLMTALESMQTGRFFVYVAHHCFAVVDGRIFDNRFTKRNCRIKAIYQAPLDNPDFLSRYPYLEKLAALDKIPDIRGINERRLA
jgi:hypothetical protein